ncbi:uncharacterized protein A1O9_05618 [Exophiala aquamarina CBS 119918]|uniref:Calponin-homology (CH) domain-containing protein n=1 Tax=Exophiala aquamarina CBS 119918 TaxID=1182545 RepID=A0A072PQB5_9EURO|nr:uncharacterized protein A1O9_05618 [Exophiala aquamarina CBS 119918]KEF57700.1 hypothetical protein A1O9_05618 [Exophiala aquamarina CBS 119918]
MTQRHKYNPNGTPCPLITGSAAPTRAAATAGRAHGSFPDANWRDNSICSDAGGGGDGDTTANIEFTSAFDRPSLMTGVRPRRQGRGNGKGNRTRTGTRLGFTIYDDDEQQASSGKRAIIPATAAAATNTLAMPARRSATAQPPQRPTHRVSFAPSSRNVGVHVEGQPGIVANEREGAPRPRRPISQAPLRRSLVKPDGGSRGHQQQQQQQELSSLPEDDTVIDLGMTTNTTQILKPARRGTIYIPNEDTTMPSMYMGIFSPIKDLDTRAIVEAAGVPDSEITGIAAQMAMKRARAPTSASRRQFTIAASPRRLGGPLQNVARPVQEAAEVEDRVGQGKGKENVPPGLVQGRRQDNDGKKEMMKKPAKPAPARRASTIMATMQSSKDGELRPLADDMAKLSLVNLEVKRPRLFAPTASSSGKAMDQNVPSSSSSSTRGTSSRLGRDAGCFKPAATHNDAGRGMAKKPSHSLGTRLLAPPPQVQERTSEKKPAVPNRFVLPNINIKSGVIPLTQAYPLLTEDLATPAMYEENWLNHQQIAITQLVNNLFETSASASKRGVIAEGMLLRIRLLELYGNAENVMLFKRLQGALLYGGLRVPSEALAGAAKLNSDVGKRRAFADLWLTTYDVGYLRAALEVVIGRQCGGRASSSPSDSPSGSLRRDSHEEMPSTTNHSTRRRHSLRRFIEAFLIRNEDGAPDEAAASTLSHAAHDSWSYQRTLLRSLMLIKLLDYTPTTIGGCLFQSSSNHKSSASLLQALFQMLSPSAGDPSRALGHIGYTVHHVQHPLEEYSYEIENLAVDLRDGVRLTRLVEFLLPASENCLSDEDGERQQQPQRDWPWRPLSQQLKLPCVSRATKLHNVQVALNALHKIQGMATLMQDISAEDIVDGFREKTVKLLWGLTNTWGLGGLVDWADVEREIKRLRRANESTDDWKGCLLTIPEGGEATGHTRYKALLVLWAQVVAKTRGILVKNMTTSFADGRVFESIVDEYEPYIMPIGQKSTGRKHLSERLRGLGCSEQFAGLFSHSDSSSKRIHVFDQDFVTAALAFLCSRLLGPSRSSRAAVSIQRSWRQHWGRVMDDRKSQLKMLADECAAMVSTTGLHQEVGATRKHDEAEPKSDEATAVPLSQNVDEADIWLAL